MKELEEARKQIDQIILRCKAGEMTREKARKQILELKGDGWRIAIARDEVVSWPHFGNRIIWEAE